MTDKLQLEMNERLIGGLRVAAARLPEDLRPAMDSMLQGLEALQEKMRATRERKKPPREIPLDCRRLACDLRSRIIQNNPRAVITQKQVENWAREADLMIRIDGRTRDEILTMIEWSQRHSFWRLNILSMKTLREKFNRLTIEKKNAEENATGGGSQPARLPGRFSEDARRAAAARGKLHS